MSPSLRFETDVQKKLSRAGAADPGGRDEEHRLGKTIGHYKVVDKLGEGGLGEVYRAVDTTLDREVALKIDPRNTPTALPQDPTRNLRLPFHEIHQGWLDLTNRSSMAILLSMADPKIKATYSLDLETVRNLERMAKRLKISKSAALRRAIQLAASSEPRAGEEQLEALGELQRSLDLTREEVVEWEKQARALRQSSSRL